MNSKLMQRREFLRTMMAAGIGSAGMLGTLGTIGRAQAAASLDQGGDDFRALVTVFLFGGSDSFNMIVPMDASYADYARVRGNLAVPQGQLLPLAGTSFGLHPNLVGTSQLAAQNRVAVGLNVGAMVEPTTRADFLADRVELPPQLFAHDHQQVHWQTANPTSLAREGWLGRAVDLMETAYADQTLPFNISMLGSNTLQIGPRSVGYAADPEGPAGLDILGEEQGQGPGRVHDQMLARSYDHPLMAEHVNIRRRSLDIFSRYAQAFDPVPQLQTAFSPGELAQQLLGVARFIAVRQQLGIRRQAFFVGMGGFDTHSAQATNLPGLLSAVDGALKSFYDATVELGVAEKVTTVTLSEFGRTLSSNGDGTDHGWGGHQLAVGGAVQGGTYGRAPARVIEGPDDAGEGRLIPTTSLEEFLTPAVRWFGVPEGDLDTVFPNLRNFDRRNLGYLG
ncbi:MAG: DUF1501 domain-containing protein [Pseudomonadota bacterium]